jgi:hypothetical protein
MKRATPAVLLGLVGAATLAGCAADAAAVTPSARPTPIPTPTAETIMQLEATGEPLPAGRYTRPGFRPPITLELDGTWEAVQLLEGFFDVQQDVGSPDVIAVQFARVLGVFGVDDAVEATSAANAVEILETNPHLEVIETSDSRMDDLEGSHVTVENVGPTHSHVLHVGPGGLGIDPGRRLWIAFFDTPDGLLAIMVGGSTARWDDALTAAERVLESVRIGEDEP